jgi:hypothetical protein
MEKLHEKIPDKKNQVENLINPAVLKPPDRKPQAAGNRAFRLHNRLRFSRTSARKEIGKANRI